MHERMVQDDLVFGMLSGRVFPRNEAVSIAVMNWDAAPGISGVAGIDAKAIKVWLCHETADGRNRFVKRAERQFDRWVRAGGMHVGDDWWGPNKANWLPPDYMEVREARTVSVFSHLYNRFVLLSEKHDHNHKGFLLEKDFRQSSVFEMLHALAYSNPGFPESYPHGKLTKALGLPRLKNWHLALDYRPQS